MLVAICAATLLLTVVAAASWPMSYWMGLHASRRSFDFDSRQGFVVLTLFDYSTAADDDDDDDNGRDAAGSQVPAAPRETQFLGIRLASGSLRNGIGVRSIGVPHYYLVAIFAAAFALAARQYRARTVGRSKLAAEAASDGPAAAA